MKWLRLEHQGREVRVPALKHAGRMWFHLDGETHVVDLAAANGARRGGRSCGERDSRRDQGPDAR